MGQTFTEQLLERYADDFASATRSPFLVMAGQGSLSKASLRAWLSQDYLYAFCGYPKFASLLLSRLPFSPTPDTSPETSRERALRRAVPLLSFSIANITRETAFFEQTAKKHGLTLLADPRTSQHELLGPYEPLTKSYVDFLIATAAGGSVEEGLVVLWAMEKCYLKAWQSALKHMRESEWYHQAKDLQTETQKATEAFIDNWTSAGFVDFVDNCTDVVDGLELEAGGDVAKRCEEAFKYCLWLEQRFWPDC